MAFKRSWVRIPLSPFGRPGKITGLLFMSQDVLVKLLIIKETGCEDGKDNELYDQSFKTASRRVCIPEGQGGRLRCDDI